MRADWEVGAVQEPQRRVVVVGMQAWKLALCTERVTGLYMLTDRLVTTDPFDDGGRRRPFVGIFQSADSVTFRGVYVAVGPDTEVALSERDDAWCMRDLRSLKKPRAAIIRCCRCGERGICTVRTDLVPGLCEVQTMPEGWSGDVVSPTCAECSEKRGVI